MAEGFASGTLVDAILILLAVESIVLILVCRRAAIALAPGALFANAGAGAALLLALRAALTERHWHIIALWLVAALGFHIWDLSYRLRARHGA